jgi:sarcosine/dimethylglycine N-methyltransferase
MISDQVTETTRHYYDSDDADRFYHEVWGGEDIHIGLYNSPVEAIATASRRTVETMAGQLKLNEHSRVLDLGSGYGGAARYLAGTTGCHVTCLNLSEAENQRNREKTAVAGLEEKVTVDEGDFQQLPYPNGSFDVAWSEDAILHSPDKPRVFTEVARVLKSGGEFIFTDPMQSDDCPEGVLAPVLARIHLKSMGSFALYKKLAALNGMIEVSVADHSAQLTRHYQRVHDELKSREAQLSQLISAEYISKMLSGLEHWINAGRKGYLAWGIMQFKKI